MSGWRFTRLTVAVLAATASLGLLTMSGIATASAVASPKVIKCTMVLGSGAPPTVVFLDGCTGNTATGSDSFVLSTKDSVLWNNGRKTHFKITSTSSGKKCPTGTSQDLLEKGVVTKDNTGSAPVGGTVTAELCINSSEGGTNLEAPGTVFKLA
jgi:hypothetical protein